MLKKLAKTLKAKTKIKKYDHLPLPDDPKELAKAMFWENDQKARAQQETQSIVGLIYDKARLYSSSVL